MQKSNKKLKYGFLLKCWKIEEMAMIFLIKFEFIN
jgi:hypothetical protein